jgi:ribosome production factor 1
VGFRFTRAINALFPKKVDITGRRVVTFHNQRDFIFFRQHRYIFNEEFDKVTLQECGPRFTMRLLYIQHKTYDGEFGDYEWYYKDSMGVKRRKFNV